MSRIATVAAHHRRLRHAILATAALLACTASGAQLIEWNPRPLPTFVPPAPDTLVAITAGMNHTCVQRFDGGVLCWGDNGSGQLGIANSPVCGTFYCATRPTRVATVPVGYGDGYFRALSNRASVLVRGTRCPLVGNVSMDLVGVDVTDVPEVAVGDPVVLLGHDGDASVDADELASLAGTIPYEVLTNVSRRVPRFYLGDA